MTVRPTSRPASDVLTKPRDRRGDISQRIARSFFPAIDHEFLDDALDLTHAETGAHQTAADAHDAAYVAEQSATVVACACHHGLVTRQLREQDLHLVLRTFLGKKIENDADGFLGRRAFDSNTRDDAVDQLRHGPSTARTSGELLIKA